MKKFLLFLCAMLFLMIGPLSAYSTIFDYNFLLGSNVDADDIGNTGSVATFNSADGTGSAANGGDGTLPVSITAGPEATAKVHIGSQGLGHFNPPTFTGSPPTSERIDTGEQQALCIGPARRGDANGETDDGGGLRRWNLHGSAGD